MDQDQTTLNQIKQLQKTASQNPDTKNYYYADVDLYIHFLTLWSNEKAKAQFNEGEQAMINSYFAALSNKFIPEYRDALTNFDPDLNLQSAELFHLTPKDNKANLADYVKIEQYFNNHLTPNAVIDDINNIDEPVNNLINRHELPKHATKLDWVSLYLLINAIAYQHWFNK